jgi:hypothetical protein
METCSPPAGRKARAHKRRLRRRHELKHTSASSLRVSPPLSTRRRARPQGPSSSLWPMEIRYLALRGSRCVHTTKYGEAHGGCDYPEQQRSARGRDWNVHHGAVRPNRFRHGHGDGIWIARRPDQLGQGQEAFDISHREPDETPQLFAQMTMSTSPRPLTGRGCSRRSWAVRPPVARRPGDPVRRAAPRAPGGLCRPGFGSDAAPAGCRSRPTRRD